MSNFRSSYAIGDWTKSTNSLNSGVKRSNDGFLFGTNEKQNIPFELSSMDVDHNSAFHVSKRPRTGNSHIGISPNASMVDSYCSDMISSSSMDANVYPREPSLLTLSAPVRSHTMNESVENQMNFNRESTDRNCHSDLPMDRTSSMSDGNGDMTQEPARYYSMHSFGRTYAQSSYH